MFRSKYEGSDSARATLNPAAEQAYHAQTQAITAMERLVNKLTRQYFADGDPRQLQCVVQAWTRWADAQALMSQQTNHTGRSMRKWALATFSSSWLQLAFAANKPLADYPQQRRQVEAWLSLLASQVVRDWRDLPLDKVNNHSYWAGWAVMASSVVTDRRDLFDWSLQMFRKAAGQVNEQGFLPNELKRRQRALSYHNYALQPLVMIASFARANGVDVLPENHAALARLGNRVLAALASPGAFEQQTGYPQDRSFYQQTANLAWLAPWCSLETCPAAVRALWQHYPSLVNYRLGGDLVRLYR